MELHVIETGKFKLDGGAMFGVVPKQLWNTMNPSDENNMCIWSMRCLLVVDGDRVILFDTGMGNKQDEKFKSHFQPHGDSSLLQSIKNVGYQVSDISDVFLTHLHFDHVGGSVIKDHSGQLSPTFPNATYWVSQAHLQSALTPNFREKAAFLPENIQPLIDRNVISFIDESECTTWTDTISVKFYHGHTQSMMIPTITLDNGNKLTYAADLLPSSYHVRLPYVMSYDINPLLTLKEKQAFYHEAKDDKHYIFFEHDPKMVVGKLTKNSRGRYAIEPRLWDDITKK